MRWNAVTGEGEIRIKWRLCKGQSAGRVLEENRLRFLLFNTSEQEGWQGWMQANGVFASWLAFSHSPGELFLTSKRVTRFS